MSAKKVHLVLGSGGARGIAHFGVLDVLLESGYQIASIAGSSMGAVVGGIYAAGFHEAHRDLMLSLTRTKMLSLFDFTISKSGFLKGERIFTELRQFSENPQIEDFHIPFTAVATDLTQKKEVWFRSGALYKALRASIAIPGVFTPVLENRHLLVDGGVMNPLPLNAIQRESGDIVVAVNVNGTVPYKPVTNGKKSEENQMLKEIKRWLNLYTNATPTEVEQVLQNNSLTEVIRYSFYMTQDRITELMLTLYPPDVYIEVGRDACAIFEFYKAREMMDLGRALCLNALEKYASGAPSDM